MGGRAHDAVEWSSGPGRPKEWWLVRVGLMLTAWSDVVGVGPISWLDMVARVRYFSAESGAICGRAYYTLERLSGPGLKR